jgi:hypothetical protein
MTDIPALIERLRKEAARATAEDGKECCYSPWACCDPRVLVDAADVLSRLTASPLPEEIAGLLALKEGLPEGPWRYRPYEHDDWGVVRAQPDAEGYGRIIVQARYPFCSEETLAEHRRNGTDPYGKLARAIAALPSMLAALEQQAREIERLTKELSAEYQFQTLLQLRARIKELEAERDRLQAELRVCYKLPLTMGHPIAQKLAAERDAIEAATIKRILLLIPGGTHCDPQEIADSIRALAKPSAETE